MQPRGAARRGPWRNREREERNRGGADWGHQNGDGAEGEWRNRGDGPGGQNRGGDGAYRTHGGQGRNNGGGGVVHRAHGGQDRNSGGPNHGYDSRFVWQRKQEGPAVQAAPAAGEAEILNPSAEVGDPTWDRQVAKMAASETSQGVVIASAPTAGTEDHESGRIKAEVTRTSGPKESCTICGLNNHNARDCRRMFCEICNCNTHDTYNCVACIPWNVGPELCAAQVEGQSFFHIDEIVDPKVARERASSAVITVIKGQVTAREIELLFMNLLGADKWRWTARPVSDTSFVLRFPNSKLVQQWSYVRTMMMKDGDAQIQISPWSSASGCKGMLQQGWFRVFNIPDDQRSILTLAKVGGLVGKVMGIDESTRFRMDYVRMLIACRDVSKVPKSAEAVLGLAIYNFEFEREIQEKGSEKVLKSGIKVTDDHPPNKKSKIDSASEGGKAMEASEKEKGKSSFPEQRTGKQVMTSCPPKMTYKSVVNNSPKMLKDAKKAYHTAGACSDGEKVYIPKTIEDSDSEGDSFDERLRLLNEGQSSRQSKKEEHQWNMQIQDIIVDIPVLKFDKSKESLVFKSADPAESDHIEHKTSESPEVFLPDDDIIQGSQPVAEDGVKGGGDAVKDVEKLPVPAPAQEGRTKTATQVRRSERLIRGTTLTTKEKNEKMAKKRNLEGLLKEDDRELLNKGVEDMLKIAIQLLNKKQRGAMKFKALPDKDGGAGAGPSNT